MAEQRTTGTVRVKRGLAEMLRGGVHHSTLSPTDHRRHYL